MFLLTGNTGFIGQTMEKFLMKKNVETRGYSQSLGFDVLDIDGLRKAATGCEFIYHFAADAKPAESLLKPRETIQNNLKGCLNVLEVCREKGISLVYPSSCEIYGDSKEPMTENHPLRPPNPYASSKCASDIACYTYHRCYDVDVKVVRLFNPYGPNQQLNKVIPTLYFQAVRNEPLSVYGDGSDTRDYVYIDDVVEGLWQARKLEGGKVINLATGNSTTTLDLGKLIIEITGSSSSVDFVEYPPVFGGIRWQVGNSTRARELLGWRPNFGIKKGLEATISWLEKIRHD